MRIRSTCTWCDSRSSIAARSSLGDDYDKKLIYIAMQCRPTPNEAGWKDTVRATPGASTRIIVKFEGYKGRYVWHCHILEHEDNEMMRPYEVV